MSTQGLVLLPYLQSWDGHSLALRLLVIPRGDPLIALTAGSPNFAAANLTFDAFITNNADALPAPGGTALNNNPIQSANTHDQVQIFETLKNQFAPDQTSTENGNLPTNARVRKQLPLSYQLATGYAPGRTDLVSTDQSYSCAFKHAGQSPPPSTPPISKIPWGKVIGFLLRNPDLAQAAGLIRPLTIPVDPKQLTDGSFLYMSLSPSSDASGLSATALVTYAARIPALSGSRDLFTPILFPVTSTPSNVDYGSIFAEVEDYDDGFAKAVHCAQPQQLDPLNEVPDGSRPAKELGIRIGWDDEQVAIWMNRQLNAPAESPIGVQGYRIDTRLTGTLAWNSLVRAKGPIGINANATGQFQVPLGVFDGELAIETHPAQLEGKTDGEFWLPLYFTTWSGPSLVTLDRTRLQLIGAPETTNTQRVVGQDPGIALTYGKSYDFRVRLADHSGGGPKVADSPSNPGPSPFGTMPFRRWVPPLAVRVSQTFPVVPDPLNAPTSISIKRPLLFYPAVACTGRYDQVVQKLIADISNAISDGREPGLPDPDVDRLQITIEVRGLTQDPTCEDGSYIPIATTTRPFPADTGAEAVIAFSWDDIEDVYLLSVPETGPIPLPTARDVRLRFKPLGFDDPNNLYFGADDVRIGRKVDLKFRKDSGTETGLFAGDTASNRFSAYYFQPDTRSDAATQFAQRASGNGVTAPSDLGSRMAAELGLLNNGLTLRANSSRRVVFGCSAGVNHYTGPDLATITFTSQADITLHWLVVIKLTIARDWNWDALAENGIVIERDGNVVGAFSPNHNVNKDALVNPQRSQTDLVFFDTIDPKPPSGTFPQELTPQYSVKVLFKNNPTRDDPLVLGIRLPITTPPAQTPEIFSAGIAMSSYVRSPDYSQTSIRQKALWLELGFSPADPRDRYFARVLGSAPDPILSNISTNPTVSTDPPLAIDAENVRRIVQGQADDSAGLNAMQPLTQADDSTHWLLPLPPGLTSTSPELFGFFTYELRVGHFGDGVKDMWSTAQGRFGPPLRVTGMQHPAPPLTVSLERTSTGIAISAPYANPIVNSASIQNVLPASTLWILLYAQAMQIDGQDKRNILLSRAQATPPGRESLKTPSPLAFGEASFDAASIATALANLGFGAHAPLSVLAVEMMPQDNEPDDPLGADLTGQRILRTSPLTPVPIIC